MTRISRWRQRRAGQFIQPDRRGTSRHGDKDRGGNYNHEATRVGEQIHVHTKASYVS